MLGDLLTEACSPKGCEAEKGLRRAEEHGNWLAMLPRGDAELVLTTGEGKKRGPVILARCSPNLPFLKALHPCIKLSVDSTSTATSPSSLDLIPGASDINTALPLCHWIGIPHFVPTSPPWQSFNPAVTRLRGHCIQLHVLTEIILFHRITAPTPRTPLDEEFVV